MDYRCSACRKTKIPPQRRSILGYSAERKNERTYRRLCNDHRSSVARPNAENHATAIDIAALPEQIRGYGHVKESNISLAKARQRELTCRVPQSVSKSDIAAE